MTDKERLIELLDGYYSEDANGVCYFTEKESEELADYLLENGIAVPPCKVGDTAYQTDGVRVYSSTIKSMAYDCGSFAFDENAIGKSIFLTCEEAEQALKDGDNNG